MADTRYTRSVRVTVQFQIEEEKLASLFRGTIDRASMHRAKTDVYLLPWLESLAALFYLPPIRDSTLIASRCRVWWVSALRRCRRQHLSLRHVVKGRESCFVSERGIIFEKFLPKFFRQEFSSLFNFRKGGINIFTSRLTDITLSCWPNIHKIDKVKLVKLDRFNRWLYE